MKFSRSDADILVPDGSPLPEALARTTHLCIAAHQDDIEIMAYSGIAECFRHPDQWFTGVVVTDGAGSPRSGPYSGCTDEEMRVSRKNEQRNAAILGDYSLQIQLAHPSASVKESGNPQVHSDLALILEKTRPDVLYLHNPADKHDTHLALLSRCLSAVRCIPKEIRPTRVYGCEVWRGLDWLLDDDKVQLNASEHPNMATALMNVFDSQISGGKRYDLAAIGRRLANATFFESHATDQKNALIWAMDLSPLVVDETLSLASHTLAHLARFQQDVEDRLRRFE